MTTHFGLTYTHVTAVHLVTCTIAGQFNFVNIVLTDFVHLKYLYLSRIKLKKKKHCLVELFVGSNTFF